MGIMVYLMAIIVGSGKTRPEKSGMWGKRGIDSGMWVNSCEQVRCHCGKWQPPICIQDTDTSPGGTNSLDLCTLPSSTPFPERGRLTTVYMLLICPSPGRVSRMVMYTDQGY